VALHILLADDSVPAQNMGKKILTDAGYDVTTASNGLEALRKIAASVPDLAILDIFMPGYTGLELCQKLRASVATAALPVILTVGKLEPYRPEDGEQVHSNAVIVKPFAAAELISAVRSLVGGPPAAAPEPPAPDPLEHAPVTAPVEAQSATSATAQSSAADFENAADEPLFAYGTPLVSDAESFKSTAAANSGGPQGLVFDPDAAHTPFSASFTDLLPSLPEEQAASEESPFTEFDLEPTHSIYSGAEEQLAPMESTSPAAGSIQVEPSSPLASESAPEEVISSFEAIQPESFTQEVPALDPLLEVPGLVVVPPSILDESVLEVGEPPRHVVADGFPEEEEQVFPDAPEEVLSPEEEARHKAFEDLFNSTDLPPLEDSPAAASAMHADILPSISSTHEHDVTDIQPDPELEPLGGSFGYGAPPSALSDELDPCLLEEEEERKVIGSIPERDLLLEHSHESILQVGDAPAEDLLNSAGEQFPIQAIPPFQAEPGAPLDAYAPEVQNDLAHASEPEPPPAPALEEESAPAALPSAAAVDITPVIEPPVEAEPTAVEHLPAEPEHAEEPVAATVAEPPVIEPPVGAAVGVAVEVAPEPVEAAPAEPEPATPEQVASEHIAPESVEPDQAEPEYASTESYSVLPTFAELASGAGLAAVLPALAHVVESGFEQVEPEPPETVATQIEPELEPEVRAVAAPEEVVSSEPVAPMAEETQAATHLATLLADQPESIAAASALSSEAIRSAEAERIHQAVERVFDRFKPLLIAAIVRELARLD
jgi:CheY-like chemotaxis protein